MPATRKRYQDDVALVEACLKGRQDAWDALVERYARLVYAIPRRYGLGDADSDDIFQNVFRILLQKLDQLKDRTRLSSWLITTTHRECWRLGRRKPEHLEIDERDVRADQPPDSIVDRWEQEQMIREGLMELGDPCRTLLEKLFYVDAADYQQIAEDLGMKMGSIGPTRARCLNKLRVILEKRGFTGEGADAV